MNEINAGDVVILHLTSGATIIGKVEGEDELGLVLSRPCDLIARPVQGQPTQIGFVPYLTMAYTLPPIEKFVMPYSMILFPRQAPHDIAKGYLEATTGIALAPAGASPSLIRRQ